MTGKEHRRNWVSVDVMSRGYYVCTVKVPLRSNQTIDMKDMVNIILEKRPTLRYGEFSIIVNNVLDDEPYGGHNQAKGV